MLELLLKLEMSLWIETTRNNVEYMERILHPDFKEFGQSGKIYCKKDILKNCQTVIDCEFPFIGFDVKQLSDGLFLMTYTIMYNGERSNRSSVWMVKNDLYQLYFHQGTKV